MVCLCMNRLDGWETISMGIKTIGPSEYLIWHRYCEDCHQHWFVKILLREDSDTREVFVLRGDE